MTLDEIKAMFTAGQLVEIRQHGVSQGTGTVVRYARCEAFTVREPDFGTVCDYHWTELTPVRA